MTVDLDHQRIELSDGQDTYPVALPAAASPHGVRIDVDQLSRRVRLRKGGELTLLDAVSFSVSAGELVAIVGPSGAGKTTLLEAIAGIAPASSGSVRFDGIDVYSHLGAFRSVLGYVPQDDIIHLDLPLGARSGTRRGCGCPRRRARPRSMVPSARRSRRLASPISPTSGSAR